MQALMNVSRTSVTLALPHCKSAAMGGAALAIGGALGCRSLFVSARYNGGGGVNGVAASMNLDASRDAAIRAYSITPDTGAAIPGRLHDQGHAKEDMYFRAEDVKQLNRLTKIARAQARATSAELDAAEMEEVKNIVGDKRLSVETLKKLVEWKHHHN